MKYILLSSIITCTTMFGSNIPKLWNAYQDGFNLNNPTNSTAKNYCSKKYGNKSKSFTICIIGATYKITDDEGFNYKEFETMIKGLDKKYNQ